MSHWAEIDENDIVLRVIYFDNDNLEENYQWLLDNLGGKWLQTSYNSRIRKNFAGIGYTYNSVRDAFIPPKPDEDTWEFDEEKCNWITTIPSDNLPEDV